MIVRARSLCHKHFHCLINARQTFVNFVATNSLTFRTVLRSSCGVLRLFIYLSVLNITMATLPRTSGQLGALSMQPGALPNSVRRKKTKPSKPKQEKIEEKLVEEVRKRRT